MAQPPLIYLNDGPGHFTKKPARSAACPAARLTMPAGALGVVTDFDNDGIADIVMDGKYYLKVLRGTGGGNFTYMNNAWGISDTAAMSVDDGYAFGDIDGDGDLDLIGYHDTFPDRTLNVYRNDLAPKNWLNVRPIGLAGNIGAGGAKIRIFAAGTQQLLWYEEVQNYDFQVATSYYGYGQTERHFGLGNRTNVDVVVTFYSTGRVTRMNNVAANQTIQVLESAGSVPQMAAAVATDLVLASLGAPSDLSNADLQPKSQMLAGADRSQLTGVPADLPDNDAASDQVTLVKALGATASRFSAARPQTLVDQDLYSRLVDELLANGIEAFTPLHN